MPSIASPVVLFAQDGPNPLGIARALGRNGIPVYVVALPAKKQALIDYCRYIKRIFSLESYDNPEHVQNSLQNVLEFLPFGGKPVLIVTNETHYYRLLPCHDFIKEHFHEMTPVENAIHFVEKHQQFPLAEQAGFRILPTITLKSPEDIHISKERLVFPQLVRPSVPHLAGNFREKTMLFSDFESMESSLSPILEHSHSELITQEYVPGDDRDVLFFMASCDAKGEPRAWFSGRKWRQNPPGRGLMASGILEDIPDFVEKSKQLCRLFALQGFIGVECKQHSKTKEFVYIESSIRPEATNAIGFSAGMNLVLDSYQAALGLPCQIIQKREYRGSWVNFQSDYEAAKILRAQKQLTWKEFFKRLPRPVSYATFASDDPMPFVFSIKEKVLNKIKNIALRQK